MAEATSTPGSAASNADYNQTAIRLADALQQAREAAANVTPGTPAAEPALAQLFPDYNRVPVGVMREYERMGNAPVSAQLEQRAADLGVEFEHLGLTLGTVLHGIDLKQPATAARTQLVRDTLLERKVIFFRDQHLSEDEQVAFSREFGDLDAFPFGKPGHNPYILEIQHGKLSPGTENGWHTDVTWMERPSLGSVAQCIEVPPVGGDTLFADSHAAYLGLPDAIQERLQHLHGINDYRVFLARMPESMIGQFKAGVPFGVSHPLLRTHPETGKTALYIHGGFLRHDSLYDVRTGETLSAAECKGIVDLLLAQHPRPEYQCRFQWQSGSMAFWDNRAVQHYAASDYYPHRRLLRRVTVSGDVPYFDKAAGQVDSRPEGRADSSTDAQAKTSLFG